MTCPASTVRIRYPAVEWRSAFVPSLLYAVNSLMQPVNSLITRKQFPVQFPGNVARKVSLSGALPYCLRSKVDRKPLYSPLFPCLTGNFAAENGSRQTASSTPQSLGFDIYRESVGKPAYTRVFLSLGDPGSGRICGFRPKLHKLIRRRFPWSPSISARARAFCDHRQENDRRTR